MLPKHANPYLLPEQTTVVSRAALRDSDDERESVDADPERAQMLARLENILKRSIEHVLPPDVRRGARGAQVEGDAPRKKKRRKVEEKGAEETPRDGGEKEEPLVVPFRLLSGTTQPKPIVLAPKAPPVIISKGPALEDTEEEAERRATRAREVAVDFAWITNESRKPYLPPPNADRKLRSLAAKLPSPGPPLLLLERPKPAPKPYVCQVDPELPVEPSPHLHETTCCPVVVAETFTSDDARAKGRQRKGGSRQKPAIQAAFWRPTEGMGGKSVGYAWGYPGSWPLAEGEIPRYRRDTMKKAELA
ncbi:hypothetical protein BV20DRAFT_969891 [Pilatotrama ljubarskyi]|nr:hypothetical protein BV20DRAFT_969891 [Pilatotrama ljubarskyi]